MGRTIQRALIIVFAGMVLGLVSNAISPRRIPILTPPKETVAAADTVSLEEAEHLWNSGAAVFLDARATADYEAGHIAGALSLPFEEFDEQYAQVAATLTPSSVIIVYCDGLDCDLSHHLLIKLRQLGYTTVHLIVNGWTTWRKAGLPTQTGGKP